MHFWGRNLGRVAKTKFYAADVTPETRGWSLQGDRRGERVYLKYVALKSPRCNGL